MTTHPYWVVRIREYVRQVVVVVGVRMRHYHGVDARVIPHSTGHESGGSSSSLA